MLFDQTYQSSDMHITNIRAMLMTSDEFAEYYIKRFPFELDGLATLKNVYPSLIMEINLTRMALKTLPSRCSVLNAYVASWPSRPYYQVAVVEFRSLYKAFDSTPDDRQCRRILLNLIATKWGVTFKGKELVVC